MTNITYQTNKQLPTLSFYKVLPMAFCISVLCMLWLSQTFVWNTNEVRKKQYNGIDRTSAFPTTSHLVNKFNFAIKAQGTPLVTGLQNETPATFKINFQDSTTKVPAGWLIDYGQPFGSRMAANQGTGNSYGWIKSTDRSPLNLTAYSRNRRTPADTLLATLLHMQAKGAPEGTWEAQVANGTYDVTVSSGDASYLDSRHTITVEGVPAIVDFVPTADEKFRTASVTVTVDDGFLTINATGGTNTKINYIVIQQKSIPATEKNILFSQASQSAEVEQGNTQSLLEYLSTSDNKPVSAQLNAVDENGTIPNWLRVNGKELNGISYTTGSEISLAFDATNLSIGKYTAQINASAPDYKSAALTIDLTVKAGSAGKQVFLNVNFQDSATRTPKGWVADFGQPFGERILPTQGNGNTYGWINRSTNTPLDLRQWGRNRKAPADTLLATLIYMKPSSTLEGIWEAQVANGTYDVTVSVGDYSFIDSRHTINIEGVPAIIGFVPTSTTKFKTATVSVSVADGLLTIDAIGGSNTKINFVSINPSASKRPSVVQVNPENGSNGVSDVASISTSILNLPNGGINNETLTPTSVYLEEELSKVRVPAHVNGTGGGDAITLVPDIPLKLNTTYVFTITDGVKDLSGASFIPYASSFTTGSVATTMLTNVKFAKVKLNNATGRHATLTIGPDGKLYALSIDGIIKRFVINPDGTLQEPELLYSLQDAGGTRQQRLAIGLAFDPSSTAQNLIAYVTHSSFNFLNAPDWDGRLSRLSGANLQRVQDVLINLPRSAKDHLTNSLAFGPDGALYFTQGSNSAMGKADKTWGLREEHLLSASVLRLDMKNLPATLPVDVKTPEGDGTYSPYTAGAPLTLFASGVRNAYDLVWHSNGELYVPTNGSAAGGNIPSSVQGTQRPDGTVYSGPDVPAFLNVQQTQKDFLFRVKRGGYYGHPNPLRGEYVMNGGNPTTSIDPAQVDAYSVGTLPDQNWRGYSFDFQVNKSPNGVIEYKSNTFGGALRGKLLVVRYSQNDDIITLTPSETTKDIISYTEGAAIEGFSGFVDPLDLVEDIRTGNLYVSEYGGNGKITLLKAETGNAAPQSLINVAPQKIYDNDIAGGAPGNNRFVTIKNVSDTTSFVVNNISLGGTNADRFILNSLPAFPKVIAPHDSVVVSVAFNPDTIGLRTATLTINSNDIINPRVSVPLRGLGTAGTSGSKEPSLQAILDLLEMPVSVGDNNVSTTVIHSTASMQGSPLLGEEVSMQRFIKAGDGDVTIQPLAVFGPTSRNPILGMGWYLSGDSTTKKELFTVGSSPITNGQTVNVALSGLLNFDPGTIPFGFFSRWPSIANRHIYSEDNLNTFNGAIPHQVRVYPFRDKNGIVPFTFIIAFEENTSGFEYQDLVFVVRNVRAVQTSDVVVSPVADAFVRNGSSANMNYGFDSSMHVRGTTSSGNARNLYLKFPLGKVADVVSAKLRLYGKNTENTTTISATVFGVNNDAWTETGITWNIAPAPLSNPIGTFGVDNIGRYHEVDVTEFVKAQFATDKMVSLQIRDTANQGRTLSFNSRENIRFQPQLVIKTSGVLPASNAKLFVENLDKFPSNEDFVASTVQTPMTKDSITYNANHDMVRVRIHNKGMNPLVISNLALSNPGNWKMMTLNGSTYDAETVLPLTITAGTYKDLQVKFTPLLTTPVRIKSVLDELTIISNDDQHPYKTIYLRGLWQWQGNDGNKPTAQEVINAFGFKTSTGFAVTDPDIGLNSKPKGDEILSSYFIRVDPALPVTVRQMAAYHECCNQPDTLKWYKKGSTTSMANVAMHIGEDAQTLLPRSSTANLPAEGLFSHWGAFGFKVGSKEWSDTLLNPNKKIGIRVWKVIDKNGQMIPDTYIIANDYLGSDVTNYDYNDNMYYVTNIRPEAGPASASMLTSIPQAVEYGEKWLQSATSFTLNLKSMGQVYASGAQDPNITINSVIIKGENSAEFSASLPQSSVLAPQQNTTLTVTFHPTSEGLKVADLLLYYNNAASPLRVPLYGLAKANGTIVSVPYRIKTASATDVIVNGKKYISDTSYAFDNFYISKNIKLTDVRATDDDSLYFPARSSNGDKRPFRYEIPLPNGTYWVRLHFAEIYWGIPGGTLNGGAGSRVMSVRFENELRLVNLDIAGEVGSAAALLKNIPVTVTDGVLNINFSASADRPLVSAIEVFQFKKGSAIVIASPDNLLSLREPTAGGNLISPRIYPNPLHQKFTIEFPTTYQGIMNLQLNNVEGKVYHLGQIQLRAGGMNVQVDLSKRNLPPGVYFLRILSDQRKTDVIKLLIQ